jgi:GNAT superfamily N-acetyltransferase
MNRAEIRVAESEADVRRCFPVMHQLRPHVDEARYIELVLRMMQTDGFRIAFVEDNAAVTAVAGYRFMEMLYSNGRVLYVDDLVTDQALRSRGYGQLLLDWLMGHARTNGCVALTLDSGVQRYDAHRFYFSQRMHISSYHFSITL